MASPSPEPTSTNYIDTQRVQATMEAFLQASNCSEYTKNAWLYLKKSLQKLSTTQSNPPSVPPNRKRSISVLSTLLLQASLYADQACKSEPQGAHDKSVPGRAL